MPKGIVITGLNGCGKSTVCKKLAEKLNYYSMDVEDYYFIRSDVPYSKFHTHEETQNLMIDDITKYNNYVLATVNCDWGEIINSTYEFAVILKAPLKIRMERIYKREYEKFGNRVLEGGDLYESQLRFHNKVLTRTDDHIAKQIQFLNCPVLDVDATFAVDEVVDIIYKKYLRMNI